MHPVAPRGGDCLLRALRVSPSPVHPVDLTHTNGQVFLQQNGFIWEKQRIAIQNFPSNGEPSANPEKQRGENSFIKEKRKLGEL